MDPEKVRAAGAKGGGQTHALGRAYVWTPAKAQAASRKGVLAKRKKKLEREAAGK